MAPDEMSSKTPADVGLLTATEPPPYTILNPGAEHDLLLVCDHASRYIPKSLDSLGLDAAAIRCHLAVDIGAREVTEQCASALGVTTVLCGYSRLVVDCNRELTDPAAFLEFGDGVEVPGNRNLSAEEKTARATAIYWPYHNAITAEIERLQQSGQAPALVSIHSFTPVLDGVSRPWEIGVLWDADPATAKMFVAGFEDAGFVVGDNLPYSGKAPQDFTIDHHAEGAGLPHVGIEIRQDISGSAGGAARVSKALATILRQLASRSEVRG